MNFSRYDKVNLLSKRHGVSKYNPVINTVWECTGTVVDISGDSVLVKWNNSTINLYNSKDLVKIIGNRFNYKSIW